MTRKTPIRLNRSYFSDTIYALTNYRELENGVFKVVGDGRHDVTADFDGLLLALLINPDSPDIISILDGAAEGEKLTTAERRQVRTFRERLAAIAIRHNDRIDANAD